MRQRIDIWYLYNLYKRLNNKRRYARELFDILDLRLIIMELEDDEVTDWIIPNHSLIKVVMPRINELEVLDLNHPAFSNNIKIDCNDYKIMQRNIFNLLLEYISDKHGEIFEPFMSKERHFYHIK